MLSYLFALSSLVSKPKPKYYFLLYHHAYQNQKFYAHILGNHILYNLGRAYEKAGRRDDAERAFRGLIEGGDMKQARYRLGAIAESRSEVARALIEYERALEIDPDYPEALRSLGFLHLRTGNHLGGSALLQHYLAIRPGDRQVAEILAGER